MKKKEIKGQKEFKKNLVKFEEDSIKYILSESNELLKNTMTSFRQIVDRSYILGAVYLSVLSFSFNDFMKGNIISVILLIGLIITLLIIGKNFFPKHMSSTGTLPSEIADFKYYQEQKGQQLREILIDSVINNQSNIESNKKQVLRLVKNFKASIITFSITILFFGLFRFFTECFI